MPCALTQNLGLACRQGMGGIKAVFITEYANTDTLTTSGGTVTAWTLETGKQFFRYDMRKETGSFTQTTTINDANGSVYYAPSVVFQLPRLQVNTLQELALLAQNDVVVIVLDNNGGYWAVGTDKGLQMTTGSDEAGSKFGDFAGSKVTIANGGEQYTMLSVPSALIAALITPAT